MVIDKNTLGNPIGKVIYLFEDGKGVKIELSAKVKVGDTIYISIDDEPIEYKVDNIKIEGISVPKGFEGDTIELNVGTQVPLGSIVYKLS
ncbi:MAG: hypothetical protein QXW10_02720 [Candidatus Micrarchaeaceae archaeon]